MYRIFTLLGVLVLASSLIHVGKSVPGILEDINEFQQLFDATADESESEATVGDYDEQDPDLTELMSERTDKQGGTTDVADGLIETGWSMLFSTGDGRRWSTMNFAYQVSCYQGRKGNMLEKGLYAFGKYVGYGCYCGGGLYHGNYRDATDLCCKHHDICYTYVAKKYNLKTGCHTYTTSYDVSCCKDEKITKCQDSGPSAARELCECDQVMSKCLAEKKVVDTYNAAFMNDRIQCNATGKATKVLGLWDILETCKHASSPLVTFPQSYGSEGTCPKKENTGKTKANKGWFFKK